MRARTGRSTAPAVLRLITPWMVLAACCALIAGCTQSTAGSGSAGSEQPGTSAPELSGYYDQQLSWGPCADFATKADDRSAYSAPNLDCTRLKVPIDYANPGGGDAEIAVLRQKATGDKIGSLLFNPGGPGASGNSLVATLSTQLAKSPLSQRFDLIGFDPRGVGASTPTIDCQNNQEWEQERADLDLDPSPAGVAQTEKENKDYVDRCVQRSDGATFLANIGTRDVVKDMDILRQALGDQKLTYLGYSNGTRLGTAYAEAFPQNVRALVLDGALDPKETTVDRTVKQNAGFQLAFDAFAKDCAAKPACPLGQDAGQATATFQQLTRPLIQQPVSVQGRELSYKDAVTGTLQALYAKELWPALTRALSGLAAGDGRVLLALADFYYGRGQDGSYDNAQEAFVSIECVDEERITDRAVEADLQAKANAAAPFQDPGTGPVGALDPCSFWPSPPTSQPHVPNAPGLPPTIVVSVTGDPATPYQAGVDLAAALGGKLISVQGNQHTASLQGNKCIDDVVTDYLVDLKVPAGQTDCTL
jgi:pimeloyl-ACP methyl ester carboxylesterase